MFQLGFYNSVFVLRRPLKPNDDTPSTADDPILAAVAPFLPIFYGTNVVPLGDTGELLCFYFKCDLNEFI